ncbi:hypothetical protein PENTCL1PPCAC_16380, partial [Pristionchus entomophagus]
AHRLYWPFSVFLLNPFVIYVLVRRTNMSVDCKAAFLSHHIILIGFDLYNGLFYRMYPLGPLPIFVCTGILCTDGISPRLLITILSFWTIAMCVPYLVIMLRMQQKMIPHDSPFKLTMKAQVGILLFLCSTLVANIYGFGVWSTESPDKDRIL